MNPAEKTPSDPREPSSDESAKVAPDGVNVVWHEHSVTRETREQQQKHRGCVIWFTGLSGCGKSTIANLVDQRL